MSLFNKKHKQKRTARSLPPQTPTECMQCMQRRARRASSRWELCSRRTASEPRRGAGQRARDPFEKMQTQKEISRVLGAGLSLLRAGCRFKSSGLWVLVQGWVWGGAAAGSSRRGLGCCCWFKSFVFGELRLVQVFGIWGAGSRLLVQGCCFWFWGDSQSLLVFGVLLPVLG